MSETDLVKLYSQRILRLAASIPHLGRLPDPDGSAVCRAPLCGSTVTVDIKTENGAICDFRQDVKACALGQAAASVVGANIIGCDLEQITAARDELSRMLKDDGPAPQPPFDGLEVLRPARDFTNRHASILLCLNAAIQAASAPPNAVSAEPSTPRV